MCDEVYIRLLLVLTILQNIHIQALSLSLCLYSFINVMYLTFFL